MKKETYLERASYSWSEDSVRLILTPSVTAKSIHFYAQECGYFKTAPPYFTERTHLNSFLIIYTLSGHGILNYQNQEYHLFANHCFFLHCMEYHNYETAKNDTWEFLWVHFNAGNALGFYEEFVKNGFQIQTIQNCDFFEGCFRKIIRINQAKEVITEITTSRLILDLLSEILIQKSTKESGLSFIPEWIQTIMKYIDKNYIDALSLALLSVNFHMSKFHLAKEFKKYTGMTIGDYILTTRLSAAKELLKYSEFPIRVVCENTGFNNVSHFINQFKAREGVTPLAFRKEWRL